jgi:hypothetical protein
VSEARGAAFSPKVILALVAVGIVSFAGLAVLSAYAPDLRTSIDGGADALSSSAVGFKGAVVMMKALDAPVVISRARPRPQVADESLLILTPGIGTTAKDLRAFPAARRTLIVLPKWSTAPEPLRPGFVQKAGLSATDTYVDQLLKPYAKSTTLQHRKGVTRPQLFAAGAPFRERERLSSAEIDRLQTISGADWGPVLYNETGQLVLVRSRLRGNVFVLSDPDLLNTQGLAKLDNARTGMAIIEGLRAGHRGVLFDVTLNGHTRGRGIGRMVLEPPWLAATLCGVAAALLMGLHGLARFGPARSKGRAIALGQTALVDNSAGLVRMARKEHELAPAYAALTLTLIGQAAGGERTDKPGWLAGLARLRGATQPEELAAEAERAKTRDDLLTVARKLYHWRLEMTRERR